MTNDELTCRELVELVTEYLENALNERERARFEQHLEECSGCRAYLDQLRRTVVVLGCLSETTIDSTVRDTLLDTFRNWKRGVDQRIGGG